MSPRLRLSLLVVMLLGGCTLTTDLTGLAGPPIVGADAAPPATDAATDAEAGPAADAGADATGCAGYPDAAFCVDFEKPGSLAMGTWDESDVNATNGTLTLTQTNVVSPKNAALFDLTNAGSCSYLQVTKELVGSFSTVTTRLDLRIESEGIFNSLSFSVTPKLSFALLLGFGGNRAVRFFIQKNADGVFTEPAGQDDALAVDAFGRWLPVSLTASMTAGTATATIGTTTIVLPLPAEFVARNPFSTVGPFCTNKPQRATVDDVVITTTR